MPTRTVTEALSWLAAESKAPSQDWTGYCQKLAREAYGIGPNGIASAYAQWLAADPADKYPGSDPSKAPVGAALIYKGSGPHGHVMIAAPDGKAWSNDLVRPGKVDLVSRTAPISAWRQSYLGYLTELVGTDLPLSTQGSPTKQRAPRYQAIAEAIKRLENARATAERKHDRDDVVALTREIKRLRKLHRKLRKGVQ